MRKCLWISSKVIQVFGCALVCSNVSRKWKLVWQVAYTGIIQYISRDLDTIYCIGENLDCGKEEDNDMA